MTWCKPSSRFLAALAVAIAVPVGVDAAGEVGDEAPATEQSPPVTTPAPAPVVPAPVVPAPVVPSEPAADDVAGAPAPGAESGRIDRGEGGDSTMRIIGRGALFVPKLVAEGALAPVRGWLWADDKYQLQDLYYRIFFNRARTIGVTPTFGYDYGYGVNGVYGGARFVDRDLFGEHEHLAVTGATGVLYRQMYALELKSGDRFGRRFHAELDVGFEQRPEDPFYGIGNGDLVAPPLMMIDPRVDSTAVLARYRQQRMRVAVAADERVWRGLHLRAAAAASEVDFGASDQGVPIDYVYETMGLVGYHGGVKYGYGELELRWDDRHRVTEFEPRSLFAAGSLASVYVGREHRLDAGSDFSRYGLDLQHFIRVGEGPRIIAFRVHGEGVTGSLAEVPFTELPMLGGLTYLRGYPLDRFRDRLAAFGSVEYEFDLTRDLSASVFVDAGRVYSGPSDFTFDQLRVGYGVGIEDHTPYSFVLQGSITSSIDGGLGLNLAFNPVFDTEERVRRK